jgi:hypothetical protein
MSAWGILLIVAWIIIAGYGYTLLWDELRAGRPRRPPVRPVTSSPPEIPIARARIYYGRTGETRPVLRLLDQQRG